MLNSGSGFDVTQIYVRVKERRMSVWLQVVKLGQDVGAILIETGQIKELYRKYTEKLRLIFITALLQQSS